MELNILNLIILALVFVFGRAGIFYYWSIRTKALYQIYQRYLVEAVSEDKEKQKKALGFYEKQPEIRELFSRAGIGDWTQTGLNPLGFNYVEKQNYSAFENIPVLDPKMINWATISFLEASGFYKKGILDSFNPIFWGESFLKLPGKVAVYLGAKKDSIKVKISNVFMGIFLVIFIIFQIFTGKPFNIKFSGFWGEVEVSQAPQ